jgi:predicted phage terminase large subunit-like protein
LLNGYEIPCDWREKKGELLTDNQSIAEIVKKASPYVYCSQYQQEPTGEGDRAFQPEWLMHRFEHAPKPHEGLWCISVDTAQRTREENDFTVMQVWCKFNARLYLVEQIRGHWDFDEICKQLIALAAKYPQARAKLVEGRANGDAVITHLGKTMMGIETIDPEGGKESRAAAVGPYFAAGNVLVASSEWTTEWVKELGVFPRGKHDDQVDATTQAIVWLADRAKLASIDPDVALALAGLYKILGDDMPPLESGYRAWRVSRSLPR